MYQTTIKATVHCTGTGLHSGKIVTCTLRPAPENTGIVFYAHQNGHTVAITPAPELVTATSLATTISKDGAAISTVEHLLAALRGLSIDNIYIDITGTEIPILDGSAAEFVRLLTETGILQQKAPRQVLRVTSSFVVGDSERSVRVDPYEGFAVDYTIKFPHPSIGTQQRFLNITPTSFNQVARARTFGFMRDVKALHKHGLALGGTLANAIVLDDTKVLNVEGLRYGDEFVRHKLLDFIGDMAVLPLPLYGKFTVVCSGHALNNEFARYALTSGKLVKQTLRPSLAQQDHRRLYPYEYEGAATHLMAN